jgi:cell division protein FtsB
LVLIIVAGILVLGDLNQRMADARQLEQDASLLKTEVTSLESENQALQTQVAEATSEAAVERWARSEGKMVRPGEILVFPVAPTGTRFVQQPTPTPLPPLPSNWEVWWALFFGE